MATHQELTDELLAATRASRTTVRLLDEGGELRLVAESLAPGVVSMRTGPVDDPTVYGTYIYLETERRMLIQNDCRTGEPRPPDSLIDYYHVHAQMLAPVIVDGEFVGTISVHLVGETRQWDDEAIGALADARARLEAELADASP